MAQVSGACFLGVSWFRYHRTGTGPVRSETANIMSLSQTCLNFLKNLLTGALEYGRVTDK